MPDDDAGRRLTERARRRHEVEVADLERLRPDDPGDPEPAGQPEREQDRERRRPIERGSEGHHDEKKRKSEAHIDDPHQGGVEGASLVPAGDDADDAAEGDGDPRRGDADQERGSGADGEAGEDVAEEPVGAEPVLAAGADRQVLRTDTADEVARVRIVARDPRADDGEDDEQADEDSPDALLAIRRHPG